MAKQHLLVVDQDPQSLRLMEVSLRQAGFAITTAATAEDALKRLEGMHPALIVASTDLPDMDGYALVDGLKADARYGDVPFIFITTETAIEAKIKGLEMGADDVLSRPIYTRELVARVRMALEREKRRSLSSQHRFFGDLAELSVVDLLQTVEIGRRSGRARISSGERRGTLWFADGRVADAEAGSLQGEEALYRMFTWQTGTFEMDFRSDPRPATVDTPIQALLVEGVRRMDEWSRITEQLPDLGHVLLVDYSELAEHLGGLDPSVHDLLRLFDGRRTARQVVDESSASDLEALRVISRLYFEGILYETPANDPADMTLGRGAQTRPPSSRPASIRPLSMPPAMVEPEHQSPASIPPPAQPVGLVDDLIRSAVNLPASKIERGRAPEPRVEGSAHRRPPTPQVPAAAPRTSSPNVLLTARVPTPQDPLGGADASPHEQAFLERWENQAPADGAGEDLFGEPEPVSRAAYVALALLGLVVIAMALFFMRDNVTPFNPGDRALNKGWHRAPLKAKAEIKNAAPIPGDWTLPASKDGPAPMAAAPPSAEAAAPESADDAIPAPTAAPASRAAAAPQPAVSDPVAPPPSGDAFAKLLDTGKAMHKKGRYAQAASTLARAVKLRPGDARAHLAHADALFEAGRDEAALSAAKSAIRLKPGAAKAHLIVGTVYQMKGKKQAAIEAYDKYLQLAPNSRHSPEVRSILQELK